MTLASDFTLHAETTLPGLNFEAMKAVMLYQAHEHSLPVIENTDSCVSLDTQQGHIRFTALPDGIAVKASAPTPDWLFMLKDGLVEQLAHFAPDAVAGLRWSDGQQAGELPPNFHFGTVQSIRQIGTSFLRVRIKADGLDSFGDDAIHFRVVLPPKGLKDVEWPHVSENGATVWPKGDKALHRPVYTTRWIDHAQGLMDFDVFVHEGGRVTDWTTSAQAGARVAIVGPGGGGVPDTNRILMFADETALPATARILESLPDDTLGHVTVLTEHGAECAYPLTAPKGVSITWLSAEREDTFADLAIQMTEELPDHFLWFACEKTHVQKVRAAYKAKGRDAANAYLAAYWVRK